MKIGKFVRRMSGPFEPLITDAYRSFFVSLPKLASAVHKQLPVAPRVPQIGIEIGCGEGALLDALSPGLSTWKFVGLDLCEAPGRLFRGDRSQVHFLREDAMTYARSAEHSADLILLIDVLHHVPQHELPSIWMAINHLSHKNTVLVIKEWVQLNHPICWFNYLCERFITGDRIHYRTTDEWKLIFQSELANWEIFHEEWTPPWKCNHSYFLRPSRVER